jgi:beta-lactamase regulating signal transducer with metallopeptidase domain
MIPFYKLPFDICLYNFTHWSYIQGINPYECAPGTRTLDANLGLSHFIHLSSTIEFSASPNCTFTIADLFAYKIPLWSLYTITAFVFTYSICFLYKTLKTTSKNYPNGNVKTIHHPLLSTYCQKQNIQVLTTKDLSPACYGFIKHTISLPSQYALAKEEWEAILAHEIEHCRYKDTLTRHLITCIRAFFWWIPTKWLSKKIEETQEICCDQSCHRYNIDPIHLAKALYYFAKQSTQNAPCYLNEHIISKRVHLLLSSTHKKPSKAIACLAIFLSFFAIFLGRFWIF